MNSVWQWSKRKKAMGDVKQEKTEGKIQPKDVCLMSCVRTGVVMSMQKNSCKKYAPFQKTKKVTFLQYQDAMEKNRGKKDAMESTSLGEQCLSFPDVSLSTQKTQSIIQILTSSFHSSICIHHSFIHLANNIY